MKRQKSDSLLPILLFAAGIVVSLAIAWLVFHALRQDERSHVRLELSREAMVISVAFLDMINQSLRMAQTFSVLYAETGESVRQRFPVLAMSLAGRDNALNAVFWKPGPVHPWEDASSPDFFPAVANFGGDAPTAPDKDAGRAMTSAIARARDSSLPAATGRLGFPGDTGENAAVRIFFPLYAAARSRQGKTVRSVAPAAFFVVEYRLTTLMRAVFSRSAGQDILVALVDVTDNRMPVILACNRSIRGDFETCGLPDVGALRRTSLYFQGFPVADRKWELHFLPGTSFIADRKNALLFFYPLLVLFSCLISCFLVRAWWRGRLAGRAYLRDFAAVSVELDEERRLRTEAAAELTRCSCGYRTLFENASMVMAEMDFSEIRNYFFELRQRGIEDAAEFFASHPGEVASCLLRLKIRDVNSEALRVFGARDMNMALQRLQRLIGPETLSCSVAGLLAISRGKMMFEYEVVLHSFGGIPLYGILRWVVVPGHQKQYGRVLVWFVDTTAKKGAEEKLRLYGRRMSLLHSIDHAILDARSTKDIARTAIRALRREILCLGACVYLFDHDKQETLPLAIDSVIPIALYSDVTLAFRCKSFIARLKVGATLGLCDGDLVASCPLRESLRVAHIAHFVTVPLVVKGDIIGALSIFSNNTQDIDAEQVELVREVAGQLAVAIQNANLLDALSLHRGQLQNLSRRLVETEEGERRRIASDLHDKVGQQLTALGINLNILRQEVASACMGFDVVRIDDSLVLLEEMTEQVRDIMSDLRPPVLDDYGLGAALRWFGTVFTARTGIPSEVSGGDTARFVPALEIAVFRVVQEALTNVAKHSGATSVEIHCELREGVLFVTVEDNGRGWDENAGGAARTGLGLISMRERIESFGGWVTIRSRAGVGTTISVEVRT